MAAFIITADQSVPVSVVFDDDHGNPAAVDGVPVWTVSDATILTVTAADDGMSATVAAVGPAGQAQVSVTANAEMDSTLPAIPVIGLMDMQVVAGDAALAVITPGSATPPTP